MNRFILVLFLVTIALKTAALPSKKEQPNIILINIDDMGWKDVGFMGSEYYETPNIDRLAGQGMVFTNGYAAAANCAPSRACLMTGQWPQRHGIYTVGSSERGKSEHRKLIPIKNTETLSSEHTIITQSLKANGYLTCHAGKWHLSDSPLDFGFDKNIGGNHSGHPKSYYPPYKNPQLPDGDSLYLTDFIMEKTIEWVGSVEKPFFLYYSSYAVHTPIQAVEQLLEKYENKAPHNGQGNAKYASMVENLDRNIGLLIDKLIKKGEFDNTFIVFTSDNGGLYGITQQKPLRAGKGSYYEGGIREPFFFVWSGQIESNTKCDVPISNLDIYPTLLSVGKVKSVNQTLDGKDILPLLKGEIKTFERPLFWHFPIYLQAYKKKNNQNRDPLFRTRPGSVVRYGDWKLHYNFEDQAIELYKLKEDIGERHNLAMQNPEKVKELMDLLERWWDETKAPIPTDINPQFVD